MGGENNAINDSNLVPMEQKDPDKKSKKSKKQTQIEEESLSKFTGGAFANFGIGLATALVTLITLGLAYPAMLCWKLKWETEHTYITGKKLVFDGKASQIYGKYILWLWLTVITVGLYGILAMPLNIVRWTTKHTHFEGYSENEESKFTGHIWGLFGINFVSNFVTLITLTLGSYWAHCYRERWMAKHKIIDGQRIKFTGKGYQYFTKRVVWNILTIITFGIYVIWLEVKNEQWTTKHIVLVEKQLDESGIEIPIAEEDEKPKKEKKVKEPKEPKEPKIRYKKDGRQRFTDFCTVMTSFHFITFWLYYFFLAAYVFVSNNGGFEETALQTLYVYQHFLAIGGILKIVLLLLNCMSLGFMMRTKGEKRYSVSYGFAISNLVFMGIGFVFMLFLLGSTSTDLFVIMMQNFMALISGSGPVA